MGAAGMEKSPGSDTAAATRRPPLRAAWRGRRVPRLAAAGAASARPAGGDTKRRAAGDAELVHPTIDSKAG